jgi:hypothetical protein
MDHKNAVRDMMTERYLLRELSPAEQDAFEEHFFECGECAHDIRAGSTFITYSKSALADAAEKTPVAAVGRPAAKTWFGWLRPAFAAPVLAVLLLVVAYQNLVTYPRLRTATQAQVLPWLPLAVGTWSGEKPAIAVPAGKSFLLFVRIPSDGTFARYSADLYNPAGKLESSFAIPSAAGQDEWPVLVPAGKREPGGYRIVVSGTTSAGERKEIGSTSFDLRVQ